jgi:hypothetical protein
MINDGREESNDCEKEHTSWKFSHFVGIFVLSASGNMKFR